MVKVGRANTSWSALYWISKLELECAPQPGICAAGVTGGPCLADYADVSSMEAKLDIPAIQT